MEPVTLDEAKLAARIDSDDEDTLIASWITVGRRWVESYTGHVLVQRDVTERFDCFGKMRLRAWPVAPDAAVTLTYSDATGAQQVFDGFRLDAVERPALLLPNLGTGWPSSAGVTATFQAGYASPADVPAEMKAAIQIIVTGMLKHRVLTDEYERAAASLCQAYKVWSV
jgi:uncharacterized phiE125 gp8 family phage protein